MKPLQKIVALVLLATVEATLKSKCEHARPITVGTPVTTKLENTFYGPIVMTVGNKALRASMNYGFFPAITLYKGSCDSLKGIVTDVKDDSGTVTAEWRPVQGSTYYVAVSTQPGQQIETLLEYITPPPNDRQGQAATLELGVQYLGSTVNATTGNKCSLYGGNGVYATRDVWYRHNFVTNDTAKLRIVGTQDCLKVGIVINGGECNVVLNAIPIPPDWSSYLCPHSEVIPLKPQAGDTLEFSVSYSPVGYNSPSPGFSDFKIKLFTY